MIASAIVVALAVASAEGATTTSGGEPSGGEPNGYAIIWGGGASVADAQTALSTWRAAAEGIGGFFDFPADYPRIVESAQVPGLKPGFHVVVLGLCPFDDALVPLLLAKRKHAGAYGRKTSAANAAHCPRLKKDFRVKSRHTVEVDGATLRAAVVTHDGARAAEGASCTAQHAACEAGDTGGACPCSRDRGERCTAKKFKYDATTKKSAPETWACETAPTELDAALLLELRDAADTSLDARIIASNELDGLDCELSATSTKDAVSLESSCYTPFCTTPSETQAVRAFTVSKKKIRERVASSKTIDGMCD